MTDWHTCPRRAETLRASAVDADTWKTGIGLLGQGGLGLSCSYCGSLQPGRFLEMVRHGWWVDPTDKSYKVYLAEPLSDSQVAERKREWLGTMYPSTVQAVIGQQRNDAAAAAIEKEWRQQPASQGHGQVAAKFYLQHLDDGQRHQFIELVNDETMRIGPPGYFYVPPFFARPLGEAAQ